MDNLAMRTRGTKAASIDGRPRCRASTGLKQVANYSGIVEVPMAYRNFIFHVCSASPPAGAGKLVGIAVVSVFHHIVDAGAFVSIVIVVRLPEGAEGIHRGFVIVPEVMPE